MSEGIDIVADWLKDPSCRLQELRLSENMIRPRPAEYLFASLKDNTSLRILDLSFNLIDDSVGTCMAYTLPKSKLKELYLRGNSIGDDTAKSLSNVLIQQAEDESATCGIGVLDIGMCSISDHGAIELSHAVGLPTSFLSQLDITSTAVNTIGIASFRIALCDRDECRLPLTILGMPPEAIHLHDDDDEIAPQERGPSEDWWDETDEVLISMQLNKHNPAYSISDSSGSPRQSPYKPKGSPFRKFVRQS